MASKATTSHPLAPPLVLVVDKVAPATLQDPSLDTGVNRACRMLARVEPLLGVYSDLVRYYLAVSLGVHRSTGKLLSVLASIFTELAQKGFCLPQELMAAGDGATEFHDFENGGIGEGDGTKDVSDKIENEDQVEDNFQEGQEKEDEQDKENIKSEDNAIEMSEDFNGQMHDGDENKSDDDEDSSKEDEEELDKKMGDLGEGQTDALDERMWGDDDEEEEGSEEEESGQGMDQGESELVAKDDNLDKEDSKKDKKNQDKDEQTCEDEKEKIHEQGDEREFDENEVDPYHGEQDKRQEPEAMELPEDLNLDQDEAGDDDEADDGEENPLDIDETMNQETTEKEEINGGEEEQVEEMEENQPEEKNNQPEMKEEEEEEGGGCKNEENEGEEEREGEKEEEEDVTAPNDSQETSEKEADGKDEDDEQLDSAERKSHNTDGQTGEENVQCDSAVELAGEASERDDAKEEHGSGAADASQSEGHESKLMAKVASQTQTQSKTQSFKRKPGQADNERSTGDHNERVNKRLRTVDNREERTGNKQSETQLESDLYEHIRQQDMAYDTQTYDVASADQQKPAGTQQNQNEDEDDAMETEEQEKELEAAEVAELQPDQLDSSKHSQKAVDSGEMEMKRQAEEEEEKRRKDQPQAREEEQRERSTESTVHTAPQLLLDSMQKADRNPEELRREMELQLETWNKLAPGTLEEETAASSMWHQYQALTSALSQQLCEQLRLILEPTQATKLKGDYRTGKRLNMRKVIPYIASQFRKDKIWLRRTKPSKREYQICLAVDDSSSMVDNHSKQLAFESLSVIVNALTLLEVGQVSVCSFGEQVQLLHPFQQQFNDASGARILRLCQFQQKKTRIAQFLETSTKMFLSARQQSPGSVSSETAQLLLIVSDGRGALSGGQGQSGGSRAGG
ncbi:midasin, partial [Nematolebias whitei]|uniref:midasin n=1 Tax=Nematolebias whitei TaxID=451745 RepID=UPI00189A6E68